MSWGPLRPARIDFSDAAAPRAVDFGDVYHARAGALAQARHVFLGGNGLPGRWAGRDRFVVLEAGFGLGNNFLATWAAWRDDPRRCRRLVYVAVDKHPPLLADLARALDASAELHPLADALLRQWPPLTPDLHAIDFDGGAVRLLLALADIAIALPELVLHADAFYLDGFAPDRNPAMWDARALRGLARLAAPQATLATWSVARSVCQGLAEAGFELRRAPGFAGRREMTVGVFAPRFTPQRPPGRRGDEQARRVAVVGAGLAGAAAAQALAAGGLQVLVVERRSAPATETSGQAGGLFHGVVHGSDGAHSRWLRAAALHAERVLRPLVGSGEVSGAIDGLLRGEPTLDAGAMRARLADQALPTDHVQVLAQGWPAGGPAWYYPGGGWLAPAELVRHGLAGGGIELRTGCAVERLQPFGAGWRLLGVDGTVIAEVDAVVLANAADALRLIDRPDWPLNRQRGQTTLLPNDLPGLPTLPRPLADRGYALRLADGRLLCGATAQPDDDTALRSADHLANLATLQRLTGCQMAVDSAALDGRVGWRLATADRLPLLGPLPQPDAAGLRLEQPRHWPRVPRLWLLGALGSRGISQAALGGAVLAAWMTGAPVPLPASLLDAVDPARFDARARRRTLSRS